MLTILKREKLKAKNKTMPLQQATQKRPARRSMSRRTRRRTQYVPRIPRPETKSAFQGISHNAVQNSTTLACNIAAGAGTRERVGRKIRLKSCEVMLSAASGSGPVRMTLYIPKNQGDTLTLTNIAQDIDNDKFWVIKDGFVQPNGNAVSEAVYYRHPFPLGLVTEYDGNTASDVIRNGIKLLLFSESSTTIIGHTKVWFTDN